MSEKFFPYPANPRNIPASIVQPSAAFKKKVGNVMGTIILFFIVYLLLFALSIGLIIACVYAGIAIVANIGHWIAILAGIGLIGLAVMVFVFLVKFLFAVSRFDRSQSIEITKEEQPELFAFIHQLTNDTQTPFPKKIYLSPDVNACVFYDSGFWSMFLPIRKNLQIGLGLVNSVNLSEFKAVLAHEFGHFSQRSMKLGSFVYNVNKIIHNMLFDNTGYSNFLGSWASVSDVFALFASLTIKVAQGIQWVLRKMYGLINKSYLGLSREMEFHADAVAASVSGSKSLANALRRAELAEAGYNIALQKCDDLFREKKITGNIYSNHKTVLKQLAEDYKLSHEGGLPVVTAEFMASNNSSRINYKDQWASHPSTEDREKRLLALDIDAEIATEPAWVLFRNKSELEKTLTQKIYDNAKVDKTDTIVIDNPDFENQFYSDIKRFSLPGEYKGFYDNRLIDVPAQNDEDVFFNGNCEAVNFDELFSMENASLPKKIKSTWTDIEIVKAIADKRIDAKSFDFDGTKYNKDEALAVSATLESEVKEQEDALKKLDKKAILFFLEKAQQQGSREKLEADYKQYFSSRRKADDYLARMNAMLNALSPIYAGETMTLEKINSMIAHLKQIDEPEWKKALAEWIASGIYDGDPVAKKKNEKFIESDYAYFGGSSFFETELAELNELCNSSWSAVNDWLFKEFKSVLQNQLVLIEIKAVA